MVARSSSELVAIENASRALAQAKTIGEIKEIRDKAEAVRKYAQSAALGLKAQNHAAEVKLRAERKAGQLLSRLPLRGGDRKSINHADCMKLEDLGVSQNQSTRWQLQARLPEHEFEEYLRSTRDSEREISTTGIMRLVRQLSTNGSDKSRTVIDAANGKVVGSSNGHSRNVFDSPHTRVLDCLDDLGEHRNLLSQVLEPLYTGKENDLVPAQRRVLGHILKEMQILIEDLQQMARHPAFCNTQVVTNGHK